MRNSRIPLSTIIVPAMVLSATLLSGCGSSGSKSNTTTSTPTAATTTNEHQGLERAFPVSTSVFGVAIRATSETSTDKVQHAANIMAQYLDNNEDGLADNPQVVDRLVNEGATLLMAPLKVSLNQQLQISNNVMLIRPSMVMKHSLLRNRDNLIPPLKWCST